ncbi:MAG: Asp-tRNA(Asn)/Glu-tRNA(Gln) amidotransferase subunit GatC [Planctomycetota bacterium]
MALTQAEVEKVSLLARLMLSPAELAALTTQLSQIVQYVELLGELSTDDVAPLAHPLEISNVLAADVAEPSLPRDEALRNAPKRDDECYRVPAVLGE